MDPKVMNIAAEAIAFVLIVAAVAFAGLAVGGGM